MDKSSSDESKRETIEDVHSQQIVTSQTEATATSSLHSKTTPEPTSESPSKHESSDQSKEKGAGGAIPKMTSSKKTAPSTRGRFASQSGGDVHRQQSIHHQRHHRGSTGGLGPGVGSRHPDFPLRIVVNTDMIGAIIGKSGGTIKDITRESNARVDVLRKDNSGAIDKVICIFGSPENCSKACLKIMQVVQQEAIHLTKNPNDFPLRILAHNSLIGRIIGKSGATIKKIMETTDCRITVAANIFDSSNPSLPERVITIIGNSVEAACNAEEQISQKLRSCYENEYALASMIPPVMPGFASQGHIHPGMMHHQVGREGPTRAGQHPQFGAPSLYGHLNAAAALLHNPTAFAAFGPPHAHPGSLSASALGPPLHSGDTTKVSVNVYVPAYAVGGIIGPKGSTIREITQLTGAQVKVPQLKGPQGGDLSAGSSERKVTVVGTQEAQWRAQFHIFKKVLVDSVAPNIPMETTLRVEIMVPSSQVGRIIGKNGQTVRELQRLTHAQIKLPEPSEEGSSTASTSPDAETPVSITGDFYSAWVSVIL
jgi:insulin-like growth factor 2 mRNA-binding protein 1